MNYAAFQTLKTPRLVLRKLRTADTQTFFDRLGSSQAVTRYMLWVPHKDLSESAASIQKVLARYETGRCYRWGIALRETDSLIGIIDLLAFDEGSDSCSFAYMLGQDFWGRGFGTEALTAVLDFAFSQMGIQAVTADHFAENPASGAVMRKAGMQRVGTIPRKYQKGGVFHDAVEYRITKEDWNHMARR